MASNSESENQHHIPSTESTGQQSSLISSGIANIPNQVHYLESKHAQYINVLVWGEAALGKTTMINSILEQSVFSQQATQRIEHVGPIRIRRQELDERGIKVNLGIVDVPELGQTLRKQDCYQGLLSYVHEQQLRWLYGESQTKRQRVKADTRIHVALYFLNPSNHRLSELDLRIVSKLTELTNVILVIAKADTLLRHELHRIKYNVRDQLRSNSITLFKVDDSGEAEPFVCLNGDIGDTPASLIALTHQQQGRTYPWGFVRRTQSNVKLNVSSGVNELSALLFKSYLPELLSRANILYEKQRALFLSKEQHASLDTITKKLQELLIRAV